MQIIQQRWNWFKKQVNGLIKKYLIWIQSRIECDKWVLQISYLKKANEMQNGMILKLIIEGRVPDVGAPEGGR